MCVEYQIMNSWAAFSTFYFYNCVFIPNLNWGRLWQLRSFDQKSSALRQRRRVSKRPQAAHKAKVKVHCADSSRIVPHLQEAGLSWWSFCKRPVDPDDHLQEAGPSGWLFAKGQPIQMIICKRPFHPDDHSQEAGTSRWSFARDRSIRMIICKRLANSDNHF